MQILGNPDFSDSADERLARISPCIKPEEILIVRKAIKTVNVDERLNRYIWRLRVATGKHKLVAYGASPRGAISLKQAAMVAAFLAGPREQGKWYATPEDVDKYAVDVLAHRMFKTTEARHDPNAPSTREIVQEVLHGVKPD